MSFFGNLWTTYLYEPLINVLVWLYNGPANENIVWAVVALTLLLRILLLPLSIISEKNKAKFELMKDKFADIQKKFKNDSVQRKAEIRSLLREHKFSPWAKVVLLGIQVLVFIVLYQVFIGGVKGKISRDILYSWVEFPNAINTNFYGFNAAEKSLFWAVVVGVVLMWGVRKELKQRRGKLTKSDLYYSILFPGSVVLFLWLLPMVKSMFILTTILFSVTIAMFGRALRKPDK